MIVVAVQGPPPPIAVSRDAPIFPQALNFFSVNFTYFRNHSWGSVPTMKWSVLAKRNKKLMRFGSAKILIHK